MYITFSATMQENTLPSKSLKKKGLGIVFNYTAPGTPQQNSCVKQKFATLFNQVCAMPNHGKFNAYLQNDLRAKARNTPHFSRRTFLI